MSSLKSSPKNLEQIQEILSKLKPIVAKVLRISEEELMDDKPLISYGVSSLMALVLLQKINKHFAVKFLLEDISMELSLDSLVQLILTKLGQTQSDCRE